MAKYKAVTKYSDGTVRTLETTDGNRAMREVAICSYEEDQAKTVSLEKDGESIWTEKIKVYKPEAVAPAG